jgi:putative hemolysin
VSPWIYLGGLVASIVVSFFFSGVETGIYALSRLRLRVRSEDREPRALRVTELLRRPQLLISTILIGNHTANYGATFFFQGLVGGLLAFMDPKVVTTLLLTPLLFVFGEITPKNLFRLRADVLVYRVSGILKVASLLMMPLALPLRFIGGLTRALPKETPADQVAFSRGRIEGLVREVTGDGELTDAQSRMLRNVLRLSSVPIRDVMVEFARVDTIEEGFTREELLLVSKRNGRTRIPVTETGTGRPFAVATVLDLVFTEDAEVGDIVREVPSLSMDRTVDQALRMLRSGRRSMAFVRDEQGETVGIVTVKDLVEEVSGELPVF